MKVELDVFERMVAPQLFPKKGSHVELIICQGAAKALDLTEEELKKYEIKDLGEGQLKWNAEKGKEEVKIDLSDAAVALIRKALKKLDDESALEMRYMTLYEKFVSNAPSSDEKVAGKIDKK